MKNIKVESFELVRQESDMFNSPPRKIFIISDENKKSTFGDKETNKNQVKRYVYDAATAFANHYLLISHNKPMLQFIRNLEPTSSKQGDLHIKFKIMTLYVIVFNSYCGKT